MTQFESMKDKPTWGGARPGSGRPKGSMNASSKERMEIKQALQQRIANNADRLFNAQFNLAVGEQYLMRRHKTGVGTKERTVVDIVDDPETIKQYLDDSLDQGDDEFFFISTKQANGAAIDSLLDRAFGKADSKLENSGEQKIIVETRRGRGDK